MARDKQRVLVPRRKRLQCRTPSGNGRLRVKRHWENSVEEQIPA